MPDEMQALCFLAGANSIFYGEKLLTTPIPWRIAIDCCSTGSASSRWIAARKLLAPDNVPQFRPVGELQSDSAMRDIVAELADMERQGLRRRRLVLDSAQGVRVRVAGCDYLSFCSNDYLGLAADPRIAAAAADSMRSAGLGAGASHLVSGHHRLHEELERALATYVGMPRALLLSSGYLANLAVVTVLAWKVQRGVRRSPESRVSERCNDLVARKMQALCALRQRRARIPTGAFRAANKIVITDAVFSMDGDVAPLSEIARLCERYQAWLVVDDAHGFGVLGEHGSGTLAHFGLDSRGLRMSGTLGKAAGVSGAFVAGHEQLIELLIQRARAYIYTTASPPPLAAALIKSIEIMRAEDWRRQRLSALAQRITNRLALRRWRLHASQTAIQPLIVGENSESAGTERSIGGQRDSGSGHSPAHGTQRHCTAAHFVVRGSYRRRRRPAD
jgi:8-amino-7-oxononanoate synthase